jgi:hypothetical protein
VTRLTAFVLATLALMPLACGGADGSGGTTGATPTASSTPAGFPAELRGTWTRELTQADLDRTAANRDEPPSALPTLGALTLILNDRIMQVEDSTGFTISEELLADADGTFALRKYLGGEGAFCEHSGPADYTWSVDGDTLTITSGSDTCADRDAVVAGTWTKSG